MVHTHTLTQISTRVSEMAADERPTVVVQAAALRTVVDDVLSEEECAELICAQRSGCDNGYMPRVTVARFFELARHGFALAAFAPAICAAREKVRDLLEELAQDACLVHFEWTALVCWRAGASLNMHFDSNREYLAQRHWSAVLYLNGDDDDESDDGLDSARPPFRGGALEFALPREVVRPRRGRCVLFSSGAENVHSVQRVESGERYALTLWFTRDDDAAEPATAMLAEFVAAAASRSAWAALPPAWESGDDRHLIWSDRLRRAGGLRVSRYWCKGKGGAQSVGGPAESRLLLQEAAATWPLLVVAKAGAPDGVAPEASLQSTVAPRSCQLLALLVALTAGELLGPGLVEIAFEGGGPLRLRCRSIDQVIALAAFCAWRRNAPLGAVVVSEGRSAWEALRCEWLEHQQRSVLRFHRCVAAWQWSGEVGRAVP